MQIYTVFIVFYFEQSFFGLYLFCMTLHNQHEMQLCGIIRRITSFIRMCSKRSISLNYFSNHTVQYTQYKEIVYSFKSVHVQYIVYILHPEFLIRGRLVNV